MTELNTPGPGHRGRPRRPLRRPAAPPRPGRRPGLRAGQRPDARRAGRRGAGRRRGPGGPARPRPAGLAGRPGRPDPGPAADHPPRAAVPPRGPGHRAVAGRALPARVALPPGPRPEVRGQAGRRAPRGFTRTVSGLTRWALDLEGHPVRVATVLQGRPRGLPQAVPPARRPGPLRSRSSSWPRSPRLGPWSWSWPPRAPVKLAVAGRRGGHLRQARRPGRPAAD